MFTRSENQLVWPASSETREGNERVVGYNKPRAIFQRCELNTNLTAELGSDCCLERGDWRYEREGIDLAVRMTDRRAYLLTAILEYEYVLDLAPRKEGFRSSGPDVDYASNLFAAKGSECDVVIGRIEDDFGRPPGGSPQYEFAPEMGELNTISRC